MDKKMMTLGTSMLLLKLLEANEMYGYQMIKELEQQSNRTFLLKEGTLYPILHGLEQDGAIISTEQLGPNGRMRKYYKITAKGKKVLQEKVADWDQYSNAINYILGKGLQYEG